MIEESSGGTTSAEDDWIRIASQNAKDATDRVNGWRDKWCNDKTEWGKREASLTADLAQARQERDAAQKAMAYRDHVFDAAESAARTALLEAAEEARKGNMRGNAEWFANWLITRAGK
jgi:hypothetical protein